MHICHPTRSRTCIAAALTALATALLPLPASGQTLISGDRSIDGQVCIGLECTGSETFGNEALKIKQNNPRILFEDTSASGSTNDWALWANATGAGLANYFGIRDQETGQIPFRIDAGAAENSLNIYSGGIGLGLVGIGTSLPSSLLHIQGDGNPGITLEQVAAGLYEAAEWKQYIGADGTWLLWDTTNGKARFRIAPASSEASTEYRFDRNGNLQLTNYLNYGTNPSEARLHLDFADGSAKILVEESMSESNPRTLLHLKNSGRPEIVMSNTSTNGEWSFGAGTDFFLKVGTLGSLSSDKTKVFTVKGNGDAIVAGTLTTGGTTCGTGCDLVFSDDYELPSISDHAARMHELGHLPNVGPTIEGQPFNLTDKVGRMLNELEHAHLYIAQLERDTRRIPALEAQNRALEARNAAFEARLARLEATLRAE